MGDHQVEEKSAVESVLGNISENFHHDSSSESGDGKRVSGTDLKNKVYRLFGREKPVHELLGGGKSADIFLWRDKKSSAGLLGIATSIWVLFAVVEYSLLTLLCHILILALALLFLWSNASNFITKSPAHIPPVALPKEPVLDFASALTNEINHALALLRDIASGKDYKKFLAVIFGLWIVSVLGSCYSFVTLTFLGFGFLHSVPALYEKYDDEVDTFMEKALAEIKKQYGVFDVKVLSKIPRGVAKNKKMI